MIGYEELRRYMHDYFEAEVSDCAYDLNRRYLIEIAEISVAVLDLIEVLADLSYTVDDVFSILQMGELA